MASERFVVAVTHGWSGDEAPLARNDRYGRKAVPLTAMVLDRVYAYAVVKQYRSDDGGWPLGNARAVRERLNAAAVAMAQERARELNEAHDERAKVRA